MIKVISSLKLKFLYFFINFNSNNIFSNNIATITDKVVDSLFFKTSKEIKRFIFKNSKINFMKSDTVALLVDSTISTKIHSFISFNTNLKTLSFYKIRFFNEYFQLIFFAQKKNYINTINEIEFLDCNFDTQDFEIFINSLKKLYNDKKFNSIKLVNCTLNNNNKSQLYKFTTENRITLNISNMMITSKNQSTSNEDNEIEDEDSNIQNSDTDEIKIPNTFTELKLRLEQSSKYIPIYTINKLLRSYKKIQNLLGKSQSGGLAKKEEDDVNFIKNQIMTALQLPKNGLIRKDLTNEDMIILIPKIFKYIFPNGLEDILQILINIGKSAILKGKVEYKNIILNGPPGIGKTSVTKLIAYLFCLLGSTEENLPKKLLEAAKNNEESLEKLIDYLELHYNDHICTLNLNAISDPSFFRGVNSFYAGATIGKIIQSLLGKKAPLVFVLDEMDKLGSDKGSNGNKSGNKLTVGATLLNLFDGQPWVDTWFVEQLTLKSDIFYVATSNVKENIDTTLSNRFTILEITPPTFDDKKVIILQKFIKLCLEANLIKNKKDYKLINNKTYQIGPFLLEEDVITYLIRITSKYDGVRLAQMYIEELFNNVYVEYSTNKQSVEITNNNLVKYLIINEIEEDNPKNKVFKIISENNAGDNTLGDIFILKIKNNNKNLIHILGSGHENYYTFNDLAYLLEGILKNINTLCSDISATYGLSLVPQYFNNQQGGLLISIPTNGSELEYQGYMIVSLVICAISSIKELPIKENIIPIGVLLPNGEFNMGKGKIFNRIIATTKFNTITEIIVPEILKNNAQFKHFLKKNNIKLKIHYAKNISDILKLTLILID